MHAYTGCWIYDDDDCGIKYFATALNRMMEWPHCCNVRSIAETLCHIVTLQQQPFFKFKPIDCVLDLAFGYYVLAHPSHSLSLDSNMIALAIQLQRLDYLSLQFLRWFEAFPSCLLFVKLQLSTLDTWRIDDTT
ncbi:hypothetical protein INT44_007841 [Umbelopsis vinacea]|uniref:Uncharacterized protein n=1 Tax=Umbelopsis vinacea TaxID=44442 RepID=A0A8H7PJW9_9FUNG|nr:hypothetical protein INT44_007841 [Umbelopsis vinacea]